MSWVQIPAVPDFFRMGKIVAIGGGQYGQPKFDGSGSFPYETLKIDREIIRLSKKKQALVTFIPTASGDSSNYLETIKAYFEKKHGAHVRPLYILDGVLSKRKIRSLVLSSDIVYVGGGNSLRMMRAWRQTGLDTVLKEAYARDIVLSGLSAGAGCWFESIFSDSWRQPSISSPVNEEAPYIFVRCLDMVNAVLVPHYDEDPLKRKQLKERMRYRGGVAICLENSVALELVDDAYRIIAEDSHRHAFLVYWNGGRYFKRELMKSNAFRKVYELSENIV